MLKRGYRWDLVYNALKSKQKRWGCNNLFQVTFIHSSLHDVMDDYASITQLRITCITLSD